MKSSGAEQGKLESLYAGVVTNIADPLRAGRVKLRVPGLIEPESGWVLPMGMPGAGEKRIGFYIVPPAGAEVYVQFLQGDQDEPRYLAGHWGAPGGISEAPSPVAELPPEEAPQIRCIETPRYFLLFDDRAGKEAFEIRDKASGDSLVFDGEQRAVKLKGTVALILEATGALEIRGLTVTINGRPVRNVNEPI